MKYLFLKNEYILASILTFILMSVMTFTNMYSYAYAYYSIERPEIIAETVVLKTTVGTEVSINDSILDCMNTLEEVNFKIEEEKRIAEEEAAEKLAASIAKKNGYSSNSQYALNIKEGILNRRDGINNYNGSVESFYSQRVKPGGGLNIPGRHVREDGVIVDGDGYVVVATSKGATGEIVETSLGTGKSYDYCEAGRNDIYTDW